MLHSLERPNKRRRISDVEDTDESYSAPEEELEGGTYDLPPNNLTLDPSAAEDEENGTGDEELRTPSKHLPLIVKNCKPQENSFVTQLTQPLSSPTRIRGPRWRKESPAPDKPPRCVPTNQPAGKLPGQGQRSGHVISEADLAFAAAEISSDESVYETNRHLGEQARRTTSSGTSSTMGLSAVRSKGPLRQTTLFGSSEAQAPPTASQARAHQWPLMNKSEPPTHHKLDAIACSTWVYPTNLGTVRDYQFNIVQRGLFHNLLVALPTGLGKTFIAATVMLNWFRWTKDSQIMFVAPTKPLVAQQVEACFNIVGIPRSLTSMLTGNIQPGLRAEEWKSKRVFFLTPQTLIHDLKSGICDPKKVILLVVDEAHRATGNYAYVEIIRFLNRFNSSFRVLALTATPGSSVETVQNVIDSLNIGRVEIRTEESLDIRQYVHSRNIDVELFENSEELTMSLELFSGALQPVLNQLLSLNAYWGKDPTALTAFGLTKARQQWNGSEAARKGGFALKGKANAIFTVLASLAHAIDLLKFHGIGPFYRNLLEFKKGLSDGSNNGKYANQIANHENFTKLVHRLQDWVANDDFVGHPKLSYLKTVVLNHFMDAGEGRGMAGGRPPSDTRIMVFVHYRDSAEEVTRVLKRHGPMIRPHVFVGQSGAKNSEGMDQKTQLDVINKFKSGIYNTIVATSIGEEGLDIGEVDLIVCYDSSSSPIRMLQRMGRTGRKRAGNIVLLLMKGKEEDSYVKAKDNYEKMQLMIASGSRLNFHEDRSPRIIPRDITPVVDKRVVDIPIENSQSSLPEPKKRGRVPKMPPKKFHMPDGVRSGFVQASAINGIPKKVREKPSMDQTIASLPALEIILLTTKEEAELNKKYCNIGGNTPQYVRRPRLDSFPVSQRKTRPTEKVGHSRLTHKMVNMLDRIQRPLDYASNAQDEQSDVFDTGQASRTADPDAPAGDDDFSEDDEPVRHNRSSRLKDSSTSTLPAHMPDILNSPTQEELPFYVSQSQRANDSDEGDSDDELPDVSNLFSAGKDHGSTGSLGRQADGRQKGQGRPVRQRTLVEDSDDD